MATHLKSFLRVMRVDHVGSLRRPARLREVFARYGMGQATDQELRQAQDDAIQEVVAKQEAHGLPVVNDGEFRRLSFQDSFTSSVNEFTAAKNTARVSLGDSVQVESSTESPGMFLRGPVSERLSLIRNLPLNEYLFTRSVANRPVKVTVLSPDRISQRFDYEKSYSVYSGMEEFLADVVAIERRMIAELVEAGCPYVQIDAPGYTAYTDPRLLQQMRARGEDPLTNLEHSINADNAIIEGFPDTTFGIHICRGNRPGGERRQGGYDAIAERLFNRLNHNRILLEYDSERAGGFEPLRLIPKEKVVVLGLITTKEARIEAADELRHRIDEACRFLSIEQLAISPQCGFGGLSNKVMSEDEQWQKIDVMMETATKVWT